MTDNGEDVARGVPVTSINRSRPGKRARLVVAGLLQGACRQPVVR